MTRRHDPAWVWMIGALGGALALAGAVLADYGTGLDGIGQAVRYTARWSFLFFWLSYAGGAMAILFGPAFAGLARRREPWAWPSPPRFRSISDWSSGWASSSARIPLQGGLLWFFLAALFCAYLLALLSFGIGMRNLGRLWRPLLFLAHDLHPDRLRPGFCTGRTRPEDPALALRRRICAVRPVEPYRNPVAPCRVSSTALRLAFCHASGGTRPGASEMPLTTTEVPTFFGPSDSPLFGVLHLPVDNQIRGGVLICGSLGKEGMDSVRLHRILADGLARRGFAVLHFRLSGLG